MTTDGTTEPPRFNFAADITYGTICLVCFLVGTIGNTASFLHFCTKKRDICRLMYQLITVTDIVISSAVLPVSVSYLYYRSPAMFGNTFFCTMWPYCWYISTKLSIFLVVCLCFSRTYSLMKPFSRQRTRWMALSVVIYLVLLGAWLIALHLKKGTGMSFSPYYGRCEMFLEYSSEVLLLMMMSVEMLVYVIPVIVVTTSCIVSTVLLVKRRKEHLVGLQRSRNKATVTILLFALLYGICNVPLMVWTVLVNYSFEFSKNWEDFYSIYEFDSLH